MVLLGRDAEGWRRYYCTVCGHIEWVAPGEGLPDDYRCPLCEAKRSVMIELSDPRLARHRIEFREVTAGVWQVDKRPPFREDFQHYSYVLGHPEGLILYDAPPLVTTEAIDKIKSLGTPRLLVVSHTDFVGMAGDWADALGIPALMGEGDRPLRGNRFEPTERVRDRRRVYDDLEIIRVPGHSPGSLAVYWSGAPKGPVLCSGDAITVWRHADNRVQIAFFQTPPAGAALYDLAARPVALLASCGGVLPRASSALARLRETPDNCARPYAGETGGVWLESIN